MKKRKIIILFFAIMICLVVTRIYAKFKSQINVNVTTTSGSITCDAIVDNPGTYVNEDGVPYFKIYVRNYDNDKRTTVPFQYKLTITNNTGSTGKYRINSSDSFTDTIETSTYTFGNSTNQEQEIDVQAITVNKSKENLSFNINLSCSQIAQ